MNFFRNIFKVGLCSVFTLSLFSCSDEEGEGGKSTVWGKVYMITDDGNISYTGAFPNLECKFVKDTVLAAGEEVYIIYGESGEIYDDKVKTSYNGKYEFNYLKQGNYKLYVLGDNNTVAMAEVKLGKDEKVKAKSLYMLDGKNTAKCGVVGKVEVEYPSKEYTVDGVGARIYLQKDGNVSFSDSRADINGLFSFSKLEPKTTYTVWSEYETTKNGKIIGKPQTFTTGEAGEITLLKTPVEGRTY